MFKIWFIIKWYLFGDKTIFKMMIKPYQLLYLALCFFTLHATVTIVQPRNTNFTNN